MKNITHSLQRLALGTVICSALLFFRTPISAQISSSNLGAIGFNGKIAIKALNGSIFSNSFVVNNGSIDLDFYFAPDDPRNGIHLGSPIPQPNGQIYVYFGDLGFQQGDTLTFIATELMANTTTRHYVFLRGDYFPDSGGPISTCPSHFTCGPKGLTFYFDPKEIMLDPSSISPIKLVIPSIALDVVRNTWAIDITKNAIVIKFIGINCSQAMLGLATFTINGITCTYENGQLTCPPWAQIPDDLSSTCAPYFEECAIELIDLLSEAKYTLPCQQWVYYSSCSTSSFIQRNGPVSIGTTAIAPNAALTVKNGIITDKIKVSNIGWADYVFEKGYPLMPLEEVEAYIARYKHLPGTPSADKVEADGSFELGEVMINHQLKIEEIFLHLIELESETLALESVLLLNKILSPIQQK